MLAGSIKGEKDTKSTRGNHGTDKPTGSQRIRKHKPYYIDKHTAGTASRKLETSEFKRSMLSVDADE